jgi:fructosamine-3-kinase
LSGESTIAAAGRALGQRVVQSQRLGGGDINDAWQLQLGDGSLVFLKSRGDAPAEEYGAEAAGLAWLAEPGGLPVPKVLAVIDEPDALGLVLEWIEPGRLGDAGEEELGRGLAMVHQAGADHFDALPPGSPRRALRFGGTELPLGIVPEGSGWPAHYSARLEMLSAVALDRGRIDGATTDAVGAVIARIDELAGPAEPPARVHGDLWSGNVHAGADGRPWLIDPAAHGAHRELDLAMLRLFGTISPRTLAAYEEIEPLAVDHQERVALWQLQPLLVHAILFGGPYGSSVGHAARHYA